jgi:phytol kinase
MGQLVGGAAVLAWLSLIVVLALQVRARWPDSPEWSRKLVHIGSGPVVLIAWALGLDRWIAIPAAAAATLLATLNHRMKVLPGIEDIDRHSYGTIAYGASITLLLWFFWPGQPAAVAAGVMVMALGDGLAGLLGPAIDSPSWMVLGQRRSLAGTLAMGFASLVVLLSLAALAPRVGVAAPGMASLVAIAAAAALVEQWATAGIDNLSVPIGVAWLWHLLSRG